LHSPSFHPHHTTTYCVQDKYPYESVEFGLFFPSFTALLRLNPVNTALVGIPASD